jgi:hypothetical protein
LVEILEHVLSLILLHSTGARRTLGGFLFEGFNLVFLLLFLAELLKILWDLAEALSGLRHSDGRSFVRFWESWPNTRANTGSRSNTTCGSFVLGIRSVH